MRKNRFTALYYLISEPRSIRLTYAAIYLCMIGAGVTLIMDTPNTFTATVGEIVILACGGFAILGGLIGAVFSVTRFSAWERIGTVLSGTALATYLFTSLWAQFFTDATGNRMPTAFLIAALLLAFIMRWWALRKADTVLAD